MWYSIKASGGKTATDIHINDFIGDWIDDYWGFGVTSRKFIEDLQNLPDDVRALRVHLNSPGGDVTAAHHIANTLRQQTSKGRSVEVLIEGAAWSAATIITAAGAPTVIADNAIVMVHNPETVITGNAAELRKRAEILDIARDAIVTTYQWKSPLSKKQLVALMDAETWMDAEAAIANGFADEKIGAVPIAACVEADQLARLPKIPERYQNRFQALIKARGEKPAPKPISKATPARQPGAGNREMTADQARTAARAMTELCKRAGVAEMAGDFLAAGLTPDQVRERLKDAGAIRTLCLAAKLPNRAQSYIKKGFTLAEARSDLAGIFEFRNGDELDLAIGQGRASGAVLIDNRQIYAARRRR